MKTVTGLGAVMGAMLAFGALPMLAQQTTETQNPPAEAGRTVTITPEGNVTYTQQGETYTRSVGTYTYRGGEGQRYYPSTRAPRSSTSPAYSATQSHSYSSHRYVAPQSKASASGKTTRYAGPAYQYEGKWMVTRQSGPSGAALETIATCANPVIITASNGNTLNIQGRGSLQVIPVDTQTFAWNENGRVRMVTEATQGNFIALEETSVYGRNEGGQQIISYMRCGTAGATAADQMCIAE